MVNDLPDVLTADAREDKSEIHDQHDGENGCGLLEFENSVSASASLVSSEISVKAHNLEN